MVCTLANLTYKDVLGTLGIGQRTQRKMQAAETHVAHVYLGAETRKPEGHKGIESVAAYVEHGTINHAQVDLLPSLASLSYSRDA